MLRFAPSPIGDMHINDLRIAMINYIVSQQKEDTFLLRIADANTKVEEGKDTEIVQILEKFAIKDDMRYHQSEHLSIHQRLAINLLEEKKAFICICDTQTCQNSCQNMTNEKISQIKQNKTPFVIRMDEDIILDKQGLPSSNFACACDDMLNDIDIVIESFSKHKDIEKQAYIKNKLGYDKECQYIYIPDIQNQVSIKWLFEEGFIPDAIINYLLIAGYEDAKIPKDIFGMPQSIAWYNTKYISNQNIEFDIEKLKVINREHLKLMDNKTLSKIFGFADDDIGKLAKLYLKDDIYTIKELESKIKAIFTPKEFDSQQQHLKEIQQILLDAPFFDSFEKLEEFLLNKTKLNKDELYTSLSILITGEENSSQLKDIYDCIKFYLLEVIS